MRPRFVCGFLAPTCTSNARKVWNAFFRQRGVPATFEYYRTRNRSEVELRLSEMFLLERCGYVIAPALQRDIAALLDLCDASAQEAGAVDTVVNRDGVLVGAFFGATENDPALDERLAFWGFAP